MIDILGPLPETEQEKQVYSSIWRLFYKVEGGIPIAKYGSHDSG